MTGCKYCEPGGDFWGYDIESIPMRTETTKGKDENTGHAYLDNYGVNPRAELIVKYSWYGKMNKRFTIPVNYCPMCGRKLREVK